MPLERSTEFVLMFRSKKVLEAVRNFPCQSCGIEDGTVVAAHSNQLVHGKGKGIKAHDWAVAALCFRCHMAIDQGKDLSKEDRKKIWQEAHEKTLTLLLQDGLIDSSFN